MQNLPFCKCITDKLNMYFITYFISFHLPSIFDARAPLNSSKVFNITLVILFIGKIILQNVAYPLHIVAR